jgi:hypothetical protein
VYVGDLLRATGRDEIKGVGMKYLRYIPHPHWRRLNFLWVNSRGGATKRKDAAHSRVYYIRTCKLCGKKIDNGSRRGY